MLTRAASVKVFTIAASMLAIAAAAGTAARHWDGQAKKPAAQVTLVYVGAEDCAPCRQWQNGARGDFRASADYSRLTYREVKSPTLFDVLNESHWPEDLRFLRSAISEKAGVPLWLIVADNQIVAQGFGLTQWNRFVLPRIKSLLR